MAHLVEYESSEADRQRRPLTTEEARARLRLAAEEAGTQLSPLRRVSPVVLVGLAVGGGVLLFKMPKVLRTLLATGAGMLLKSKID